MIKESHVIIDRYPRERQLDPELGGIFDLSHQEYTFPYWWEKGVKREWFIYEQTTMRVIKKLRELLRNMFSFFGEKGDEIVS